MRILLTPEERRARATMRRKRWRNTPEGRAKHYAGTKKYAKTPKGRAAQKISDDRRRHGLPKERVVERYLVDAIEKLGGFCPKFRDLSRSGAPDRLVIIPNNPVLFVELKRPQRGCIAPHQTRYHERLRDCGQKVWVLNSIESVDDFLLLL
jgi:hypothetical protein